MSENDDRIPYSKSFVAGLDPSGTYTFGLSQIGEKLRNAKKKLEDKAAIS